MTIPPFHLAVPVDDLARARAFYGDVFGCEEGRCAERWVDFNFFGHQLVCHQVDAGERPYHNPVDGDHVPVPHFGVVLAWDDFHSLVQRLESKGVTFIIAPKVRFSGRAGEQTTFFIKDPADNALEFKAFKNPEQLFVK